MIYIQMQNYSCFLFNDTATTEIYTLSLHDALPIWCRARGGRSEAAHGARRRDADDRRQLPRRRRARGAARPQRDRKSTRLNSSHANISYAVFCLIKLTICIWKPSTGHLATLEMPSA